MGHIGKGEAKGQGQHWGKGCGGIQVQVHCEYSAKVTVGRVRTPVDRTGRRPWGVSG